MSEWKSWGRAHREEWWAQFLRGLVALVGLAAVVFGNLILSGILWGMR